jgi:hypothetical protein
MHSFRAGSFSPSLGKRLPLLSVLISLMMFCAFPLEAQLDRGGIVGTVSDPAGARIPGAKVTITNTATNTDTTLQTNAEGSYSGNNLQIASRPRRRVSR